MSNTHRVKSGETLYSLAKKYGTTVDTIKSINNLKSDLIKVNQVLKLPVQFSSTTITSTKPTSIENKSLSFPFIIAASKNNLGGNDSKRSQGRKLPEKFFTLGGVVYTWDKTTLVDTLVSLMEYGSTGLNQEFAVDMDGKNIC